MKVIAFHLPQFHAIPENDEWWGKGFTEWTNVKKSKSYYEGQRQPRIPLNDNYYNLLEKKTLLWQCELAEKYGIYGFCFYHYWFNGHLLLEKPVEMYLTLNSNQKRHYCICWANENWTKAWADKSDIVLIQQKYGNLEEWKKHFEYLLPFFKDEMYIKEDGKPFMIIYRPELIFDLEKMLLYWNQLAKENGFPGLCFIYQQYGYLNEHGKEESLFAHNIEYQPAYAMESLRKESITLKECIYRNSPRALRMFYLKLKEKEEKKDIADNVQHENSMDYDEVWQEILTMHPSTPKSIPGAFVDYDNSPRRKERGLFFKGTSVDKFGDYFKRLIIKTRQEYKENYIFVFAWNEWGESAYLEPDILNGYGYLEKIKEDLKILDELETKEE